MPREAPFTRGVRENQPQSPEKFFSQRHRFDATDANLPEQRIGMQAAFGQGLMLLARVACCLLFRLKAEATSQQTASYSSRSVDGAPPIDASYARMSRSRIVLTGAVAAATLAAWAWILPMAHDMYGSMTGLSRWMMTTTWDGPHLLLLWTMWAVMMAAMMLPSAMPLLLLYEGVLRRREPAGSAAIPVVAMAAGYLLAWAVFSVAATVLQRLLSGLLVLNSMMEMRSSVAIGMTLLLAGAYQLTPWKRVCLGRCRSPLAFVVQRWRAGAAGALKMGVEHGADCVGCCWALMLLLFAGGVMNLTVIAGLTAIVLVEKVSSPGLAASRALGSLMMAVGVWFMVR